MSARKEKVQRAKLRKIRRVDNILFARKSGKHEDRKKEEEKNKCRKKVDESTT